MPRAMHRPLLRPRLLGIMWLLPFTAVAAPHAFVSVSGPESQAVQVIDLATMTIDTTIAAVGDQPSRMVANADRSVIWLSSWRNLPGNNEGQVHRIDTRSRQVTASAAVGLRQNRTIALSPDASRVYTWKQAFINGVGSIGVAVLDATSLAEIAVVPIEGPSCLQFASQIAVAPDGRIVAAGCADGLRIIDPSTLTVGIGAIPPLGSSPVLGFSPDGAEVYVAAAGVIGGAGTGVRAIDLATGIGTDFHWALPPGSPNFAQNSGIARMVVVQAPLDPPGDPTVFFTYHSAFGVTPVAWARASDLAPSGGAPRVRRLIGRALAGPSSSLGAAADGSVGLGGRLGEMQSVVFEGTGSTTTIIADGPPMPLTGIAPISDIIVVSPVSDALFADGFD